MDRIKLQPYFLLALLVGALVLTYVIYRPFLAALALAAVLSVIVSPLYQRILRAIPTRDGLAALATVAISVILILVPISFLVSRIAIESEQLYVSLTLLEGRAYLDATLTSLDRTLGTYIPGLSGFSETASADIENYARQGLAWLLRESGRIFSSIAALALNFFIFFIALFYFLRDGGKFKRKVIEFSPLPDSADEKIAQRLEAAIHSVVKGNLAIALIQGVLAAVGFAIFGVPHSILWGTIAAVAALIPGIGTALVIIPAIIFLFVTGSTGAALGLLVWGLLAVGLVDNFLGPKLIGHGMQLHPLLVLLAVLGGILFFGPLGIFLGPLTLSLLFALLSVYSETTRESFRA
ncbi:MAG: hypothetical protein UY63_C0003G0016 [Parcubacteria group bacterium GW2011_GWA2_51_10]|nr:MAG: hypothetical protein UY63_C0003G0016 [Parcubacteria group bacterium GW2011_GWA2_51_10]